MHHNNVDPSSLAAYIVCCLTPLNKNLGVCPIGSGEVFQRIVGRVVIRIARQDLQLVLGSSIGSSQEPTIGSSQLCAGKIRGCKAAVHNKGLPLFLLMVFY